MPTKKYKLSQAAIEARRAGGRATATAKGGIAGRRWQSVKLAADTVAKIDIRRRHRSRNDYVASRI